MVDRISPSTSHCPIWVCLFGGIRSHNKKRVDSGPPFSRSTTCFPLPVPFVLPPGIHRPVAMCSYTHDEKHINLLYHLPQFISPHIYRYIPFFHVYHFHSSILYNQPKVHNDKKYFIRTSPYVFWVNLRCQGGC